MKASKNRKHLLSVLVIAALLLFVPLAASALADDHNETTILFTHDLHSHFLPQPAAGGGESGGYARLKTAIDSQRELHPDALLLDGGDYSIGSLIQTLFVDHAVELRTMGALGYDVTTIGNHEFDHTGKGFGTMLHNAAASGDRLPLMVSANYWPADDNPDRDEIYASMEEYGVAEWLILERGGIKYGIFGLTGEDSDSCAPTSGFAREDAVQASQRCVDALKAEGADFIICLSHSGTSKDAKKSEDELLAKAVDGIDVILSGHTHTTLEEPIVTGNTYIVSCGPYCENLGSITLRRDSDGSKELVDYRLIPIDETLAEDSGISALVEKWKTMVGENYLSKYGLTYDQILTRTAFDLDVPTDVQAPNSLGRLVSDAFYWASENLAANLPPADNDFLITVTAKGVLRADLPKGDITASMAFDVLSMGVGSDGTSGFPLVALFLTGKELKAAAEVDASVTPIMPAAQLYMTGMNYSFNTHRMFFNRVYEAHLEDAWDGGLAEIDDDELYRVVTGMYSAQMLGTVKSKSVGLLSLEPKMADGTPVTDFDECILRDADGNEIKEWYALAAYMQTFGGDGIPDSYAAASNKYVSRSFSPIQLVKNLNWISLAMLIVVLVLIALVIFIVHMVRRRRARRRGRYVW